MAFLAKKQSLHLAYVLIVKAEKQDNNFKHHVIIHQMAVTHDQPPLYMYVCMYVCLFVHKIYIVLVHSKDHEGVGMTHKITSPRNRSIFS